jgi:NAD(P)-dependent dehydrogenase (short-subunit alcohol dehydrogenase family)
MKKFILISGAGSGIGRAMAIKLSNDASIILCGRRENKLEETRKLLNSNHEHYTLPLDVTSQSSLVDLSEFLKDKSLYAVLANHGVAVENSFGENDRFDEVMNINLKGTYNLVNTCLPAIKRSESQYKHILVTSSVLAKLGVPGWSAYCASKAGLLGLVRSWAMEHARDKILVNGICPGWVDTDMAKQGIEAIADHMDQSIEDTRKQQLSMVPLQRMSEPEELAELANYLLSSGNKSITGQSIDINNGALLN